MDDVFYQLQDDESLRYGNGCALNCYQGTYSLCRASDKDGTTYLKWGRAQLGRDKFDKIRNALCH